MKRVLIFLMIATLISCKKELVVQEAITGATVSDNATVGDRVNWIQAGTNGFPWWNSDSYLESRKGGIVFLGNSYIENWTYNNWGQRWKGLPVINRGLGGTAWFELIPYIDSLCTKWEPKVIYVYCGENEFLRQYSGSKIYNTLLPQFNKFIDELRKKNPQAKIVLGLMFTCPKLSKFSSEINIVNVHTAPLILNGALSYKLKASKDSNIIITDYRSKIKTSDSSMWSTYDKIHPTAAAYTVWTANLKPLIDSLYKN